MPSLLSTLLDRRTSAIGFFAGLLNGMLGIGGGIVMVPGLMLYRKLDVRLAVGTSLGAVIALSSMAFTVHVLTTGFSLAVSGAAVAVAAGMAAAQIGGRLLNVVPRRWVVLVFGLVTLFTAARLMMQALGLLHPPLAVPDAPPFWGYPLFGALGGFFSGLLGIGGGGYILLGFSVFFDTPIQGGLPIALALNITNALSGVWVQRRTGNVRWREVVRLVPAAVVGVGVGSALAIAIPADAMRLLFGGFFSVMAVRLLVQALRM